MKKYATQFKILTLLLLMLTAQFSVAEHDQSHDHEDICTFCLAADNSKVTFVGVLKLPIAAKACSVVLQQDAVFVFLTQQSVNAARAPPVSILI